MRARQAIVRRFGGPEVIEWHDVDLPDPCPGEALVEHSAVGLNYIDTYFRRGIYPMELPGELGVEAAGRVLAIGPGVSTVAVGDRVAHFGPERGAYATARIVAASGLLPIPDDITDEVAAAIILKGCTAEFLVERCARVEAGQDVLVHAAAGGMGLLLVQWLKAVGARVIGTTSNEEKAAAALAAGADDIILTTSGEIAPQVRDLTGGAGVRVTFDGVGLDTWEASLDATGMRGLIVSYGNASAPVTGISLGILATKGSLYNTRPMLYHYYADPAERAAGVARLWEMVRSGKLKVTIGQRFALTDADEAHRQLEGRQTMGSTLLLP